MPVRHLCRLMPCHYADTAICPDVSIMPHAPMSLLCHSCFRLPVAASLNKATCLDSNLNRSALLDGEGKEGWAGIGVSIWLFSLLARQLVHLVLGPGLPEEGLGDGAGHGDHLRATSAVVGEVGGAV